jgi:hypothetical protein
MTSPPRPRLVPGLSTLVLALTLGALSPATSESAEPNTIADAPSLRADGITGLCTLEPGPISPVAYVWQQPMAWTSYAWRIPRESCAACSHGLLSVNSVTFRVRWTNAPCYSEVRISIVGSTGGACPAPDTTRKLCEPMSYTLTSTVAAGVTYTIPLTPACCVFEDAFVLLEFDRLGQCVEPSSGLTSGIVFSNVPCVACDQYVTVAGLYPALTEWCTGGDNRHPLWVRLDTDCCDPTPTHGRSWGRVKTLYR